MTSKNTFFQQKNTINCKGKLLDLTIPQVMGILNITPDSFYAGSRKQDEQELLEQAERMLTEGAAVLDIGGYSSRPGASAISETEEKERVVPAIKMIRQAFPEAILSVDTFRSSVAQAAVEAGASIVNDISAGNLDPKMIDMVVELQVPYILMHMQGDPQTMQQDPHYHDVLQEVFVFLQNRLLLCKEKGIVDCIVDPGFGFGKTIEHNYTLLNQFQVFGQLGMPVLAGLSRKSMLYKVSGGTAEDALSATIAANTVALMKGAALLRVHDVKPAVDAVKILSQLK